MGKLILALFIFVSLPMLSQEQEPKDLFSQAIGKNIRKYRRQAKLAYIKKDEEHAQYLFDSLVKKVVNGTYIDNFRVRKFSGKRI
nr:TlpA family protein disulfide reductase [Flavobacteriaceae bacterium]